jgi:phosphoglycolate phosphatase
VDDLPAVLQASNFVLTQAGKSEMSLAQFRAEFSLPFIRFYNRHTPHVPIEQLEKWFHAEFKRAQTSVRELPHARDFLKFCRTKKLRLFVLTSAHQDHFVTQCGVTGFDAFFERPYAGVRDKREKIHELLGENRLDPSETLFVGDMEHDIETARHGGVQSCAVLTGYNTLEQLRAAKPDLIVEHLSELRDVLEQNHLNLNPGDSDQPGQLSASLFRPPIPLATVGALIFNSRDEALMIRTHKWSNLWGIPGGKIKFGETAHAALRREILEETSLKISNIEFVLVQDCIHSKEFYRDAHFVLLNYICRCSTKNPRVQLNDEGREFRWVKLAAAQKMKLNKPTQILLQVVLQHQKTKSRASR